MTSYYAKPVPGSAALKTRPQQADPELRIVEGLPAGQLERHRIAGEPLGRVVVREGFVPVLAAVLDELVSRQTPIEHLIYLQLYRRALGEDRNFCRVARSELCAITGLSPRRFNKALGGLVAKGHVRLLQRDRQGTLYRVLLPDEIDGRRPGGEVVLGKLRNLPAAAAPEAAAGPATASPKRSHKVTPEAMPAAPARPGATAGSTKRHHKVIPVEPPRSVGQLSAALLGRLPARRRQAAALDVLQEVTDLVEEGHRLEALAALVPRCPLPRGQQPLRFAEFVRQQLGAGEG